MEATLGPFQAQAKEAATAVPEALAALAAPPGSMVAEAARAAVLTGLFPVIEERAKLPAKAGPAEEEGARAELAEDLGTGQRDVEAAGLGQP